MKKKLLYILTIAAAMLTSCSDEVVEKVDFLNGNEKTPITVVSNISANTPVTRAADAKWEAGDMLFAYVQHVKENTSTTPTTYDVVNEIGTEPRIQHFKVKTTTDNSVDNFTSPTLSPVDADGNSVGFYWDDFSVGGKGDDTDIRTSGHGLRALYGLCYNGSPAYNETGSSITTTLNEANGTLGWTVADDQKEKSSFTKSDLLWSGTTQTPVAYDHGSNNTINGRNNVLSIPFTHAMSKVTIEIELKDGYDADENGKAKAFGTNNTTPTLYANRVTSVTAPTQTLSTTVASGDDRKIQMYLSDDEVTKNKHRVYEALIAPTVMKAGGLLAQVNVDGNNYDINLTDALLTTAPEGATAAWSSQLKAYTITSSTLTKNSTGDYEASNGGITLSGVNYRIKVTLSKQQIQVQATIVGWDDVYASVDGTIMFDSNVVSDNATGTAVATTSTFDLWRSTTNADAASYDEDSSNEGIQKATTCEYIEVEGKGKWIGNPKIYWANGSTSYYFRALAKMDDEASNKIVSVNGSQDATQGLDLLWAQTPEHKGKDESGNVIQENGVDKVFGEGNIINPRKGTVPLSFIHAMSKVSVKLKTNEGDDKVDLTNAKISIINLYNGGTINISTGHMESESLTSPADLATPGDPRTILDASVNSSHELLNQIVIPQSLIADKNAHAREATPTFYQTGELTKIYSDETSLPEGGGEGTYYLTSTLDPVNYAESELTAIYADGTSISDGGSSETHVTSTLDQVAAEEAIKYTEAEAAEENAKHLIKDSQNRVPEDDGYETTYEDGYTPVTTDTDRVPAIPAHYKINANSKKATTSTFKCYKTKDGSEQHNPGELKSAGDKIMMYITLANGTRYSIELSKCKDTSNNLITKWKRGEHYTYEITLGKEEITFRALIKDWDEKTGTGNATLDWDQSSQLEVKNEK